MLQLYSILTSNKQTDREISKTLFVLVAEIRNKHFYTSHTVKELHSFSLCGRTTPSEKVCDRTQHGFLDQHQIFHPNTSQSVFLMNKLPN